MLIGVFPFLSHAVLEQRNDAFDIDGLHVSHLKVRKPYLMCNTLYSHPAPASSEITVRTRIDLDMLP